MYNGIKQVVKAFMAATKSLAQGNRCKRPLVFPEDTVLVLGNGPSLLEIDLSVIPSNISIACVNAFAIHNDSFFLIKPRYYVIIDTVYFKSEDKIDSRNLIARKKLMSIFQKVNWDMVLVIPQGCKVEIDNQHIICERINNKILNDDNCNRLYNFLYKNNLAVCGLQNVLVGALYYFVFKRISHIYIAGADMNEFMLYKINSQNHVIASYEHFYGIENIDCTQTGIIPKGEFSIWMGYYAKMLKEFRVIKYFADYQGVQIINLSPNSYIDVFEKQEWKALIHG